MSVFPIRLEILYLEEVALIFIYVATSRMPPFFWGKKSILFWYTEPGDNNFLLPHLRFDLG